MRMILALFLTCCGGGHAATTPAPSNDPAEPTEPAPTEPAPTDATLAEPPRCYPYLPASDGSCRTACASRDDCAGSRGPADLAENGWPLDCINQGCVPLPPGHVHGRGP